MKKNRKLLSRVVKVIRGKTGVRLPPSLRCEGNVWLEGPCQISTACSCAYEIKVGAFSYFTGDGIRRSPLQVLLVEVGRYCSIAEGVHIAPGQHPIDWVSTSYSSVDWTDKYTLEDQVNQKKFLLHRKVTIGNDVWVGCNATIMDGVTIGDGAIVAAHALVTKDVPPYAIVGGVPAKVIRYRFPQPMIDRLLATQWWRWAPQDLKPLKPSNVEAFLQAIESGALKGVPEYHGPVITDEDLRANAGLGSAIKAFLFKTFKWPSRQQTKDKKD